MKYRVQAGGMTLVELIVAMALTTLVAGSTAGILHSTAAVKERAQIQLGMQQQARAAVLAISTALANVDRYPDRNVLFEGIDDRFGEIPADRIRFFTVSKRQIRWGQPESDIKECEFFLTEPTEQALPALMRRTDPTRNEIPDEGGVLECIAENVLGLNLLYHDGIGWVEDWPLGTRGQPMAVRIELAVLSKSKRPKIWTISRVVNFPHRRTQARPEPEE